VTGDVNVSFYDTRNDMTGSRFMTDIYFTQSNDGGVSFRSPNVRASSVSSNEHDCSGVFRVQRLITAISRAIMRGWFHTPESRTRSGRIAAATGIRKRMPNEPVHEEVLRQQ